MGLIFTGDLHPAPKEVKMNASIIEAKEVIKRPQTIAIALVLLALSVTCIYFFSYMQWRRIVIPIEIFLTGFIGLKIASQINQAQFSSVMRTASTGIIVFSSFILIGAIIDNIFFTETGYFLFGTIALMWLWIPFQLHRLLSRLDEMPEEKKKIVTDSTDMIYAQMAHREKGLKAALDQYYVTKKKLGLDDHLYIH